MKIALIGAAGQLGTDLRKALPAAIPLTRESCDLTQPHQVDAALAAVGPDLVINTAAYNLVDRAEEEPQLAFAVNSDAVRNLANWCAQHGATLLQVSTDYVFGQDAARRIPYREEVVPGPVNQYGQSKLQGELAVQEECPRYYIVRTCGLYGHTATRAKGNFVETMLRLAETCEEVRVVDDQCCTPTFTRDLASGISRLIETGQYGTYHITNSGQMTWCEFAREIFRQRRLPTRVIPISTQEFGARAPRPAYSVLNCEKFRQTTGMALRPWQSALAEYLSGRPTPVSRLA